MAGTDLAMTLTNMQERQIAGALRELDPAQIAKWSCSTGPSQARPAPASHSSTSTITQSVPDRPNVSGAYISSALAGGATKAPGVVALAT